MTKNDFLNSCLHFSVAPEIALENEDLMEALRNKQDDEVMRILLEDF
jgi:hypothetical protein